MSLPALVQSLLEADAYPDLPRTVRLVQTHASYVLITDDFVYKVKKPVDLGFLDYSTLEKRKFFCEEEVRLNRRLCPSVYLGVVSIVASDDGFILEGPGEAVEYAVKMKHLDERRMMDALVARGEAGPEMLERIAHVLADFHAQAASGPEVAEWGSVDTIRLNTEENFSQVDSFVEIALTARRYEFIETYTRRFLANGAAFLQRRVDTGRIREGHGDLHLANICYLDEPCIYDCIEFNERFRCSDVASEVAFLAMDLDFHGRPDLGHAFVDSYVDASGDGDIYELLDFYKCYRAFVRGKTASFMLDEREVSQEAKESSIDQARRYFDLAYRYAGGKVRPRLVVMCGLSGAGKTYVADALAAKVDLVVIQSDIVRKHLAGVNVAERRTVAYGTDIYSEDMTEQTYRAMADDAEQLLAAGHSLLLDASFLRRWQRGIAQAVAAAADARLLVVHCTAPDEEVRNRLDARREERSISDATWEIYQRQKKRFEPPDEIDSSELIVIDTTQDIDKVVEVIEERLASGDEVLEQVG